METRIDDIFYKKMGELLNKKRIMLGYSYRYLSKLTGISARQLDDYMLGNNRIKKDTYKILCEALGIDTRIKLEIDLGV